MITRTLPDQSAAEAIIVRLQDMGLRSRHQLKHVREGDLEGLIPILELRDLLDVFKMGMLSFVHIIVYNVMGHSMVIHTIPQNLPRCTSSICRLPIANFSCTCTFSC